MVLSKINFYLLDDGHTAMSQVLRNYSEAPKTIKGPLGKGLGSWVCEGLGFGWEGPGDLGYHDWPSGAPYDTAFEGMKGSSCTSGIYTWTSKACTNAGPKPQTEPGRQ